MVGPNQSRHAQQRCDEQRLIGQRRRPATKDDNCFAISSQRAKQFSESDLRQEVSIETVARPEFAFASARKPRNKIAAVIIVERVTQSSLITDRLANDEMNHAVAAMTSDWLKALMSRSADSRFD